jgi:hypothetical protein
MAKRNTQQTIKMHMANKGNSANHVAVWHTIDEKPDSVCL